MDFLNIEYIKDNELELRSIQDFIPGIVRHYFKKQNNSSDYEEFVYSLFTRNKVRRNHFFNNYGLGFPMDYLEIYEFLMRHVQYAPILKDEDKFIDEIMQLEKQFNINFDVIMEEEEEFLLDKFNRVYSDDSERWEKVI